MRWRPRGRAGWTCHLRRLTPGLKKALHGTDNVFQPSNNGRFDVFCRSRREMVAYPSIRLHVAPFAKFPCVSTLSSYLNNVFQIKAVGERVLCAVCLSGNPAWLHTKRSEEWGKGGLGCVVSRKTSSCTVRLNGRCVVWNPGTDSPWSPSWG